MRTTIGFVLLAPLLAMSAVEETGHAVVFGSRVEIPLDLRSGVPVVKVRINGYGPYDFIVDTAAPYSIIDEGIAEKLQLDAVGYRKVTVPGESAPAEAPRVRAERLEAAGLLIEEPVLTVIDLVAVSEGRLQGVLGLAHFRDLLVTFDCPQARLVVSRGKLNPHDSGVASIEQTPVDTGSPEAFAGMRDRVVTVDRTSGLVHMKQPEVSGEDGASQTAPPRRLGVAFAMTGDGLLIEGGGLVVQHVDVDSLAHQAGLRAGDLVLSINEVPAPELVDRATLGKLLGGSTRVDFQVLRQGERLSIEVRYH